MSTRANTFSASFGGPATNYEDSFESLVHDLRKELTAGCEYYTYDGVEYLYSRFTGYGYPIETDVKLISCIEFLRKIHAVPCIRVFYGETSGPNSGVDSNETEATRGCLTYLPRTIDGVPVLHHVALQINSTTRIPLDVLRVVKICWPNGEVVYQHQNYRCREHRIRRLIRRKSKANQSRYVVDRLEDGVWVRRKEYRYKKAAVEYLRSIAVDTKMAF